MNILTIMNYVDNNSLKLGKLWAKQARLHNPNANIYVLHNGMLDKNKEVIKYLNKRDIEPIKINPADKSGNHLLDSHNVRFKLYNLTRFNQPYIFLDSDAIILNSLDYIWEKRYEKPWIGINHQQIPRHTTKFNFEFLNSGVQIVGDPSFLKYKDVIECYKKSSKLPIPGKDQALIYKYFKSIDYDYTHPDVGFSWNSCSKYTTLYKEDGVWRGVCNLANSNYPVYVNHYWDHFKPWNIKCKMFIEESKKL